MMSARKHARRSGSRSYMPAILEAVESRQMFSSYLDSSGTLLISTGSNGNDVVTVRNAYDYTAFRYMTRVTENGVTKKYRMASIKNVIVYTWGGNDRIDASKSPTKVSVYAGSGADTIYGSNKDDVLNGAPDGYHDTAADGADSIFGFDGNDTINGGSGADQLFGMNGADTFIASGNSATFDGGAGWDSIDFSSSTTPISAKISEAADDYLVGQRIRSNVEAITGSRFNDRLEGNSLGNYLVGGDGNDTLVGMWGNDSVYGGNGNDRLDSGPGDDFLSDTSGNDYFLAGTGSDYIWAVDASGGKDTIEGWDDYDYADCNADDVTLRVEYVTNH